MSDLWDWESRWETSTRADDGYYDQVVALSQGLINENFESLFELYKDDLSKIYLKDAAIGTIDGIVDAPRILIPGADDPSANLNQVIFQIRFKSGTLKGATGKAAIPNLSNWIFSVRAPVVPEKLPDPKTIEDPILREELEKKIQRIKARFDYPGDYSVERLYMKLSAANWNAPDWERSVAGLDAQGKEVPYLNWSLRDENQGTALRLQLWLSEWARKLDKDSRNSLGLSFQAPTTVKIPRKFVPKEVLHQVYQYKSKKNGAPNGQTGFNGAGNCNCLLYLEMVEGGGKAPKDPRLTWSGNFATQDGGADHPPIRATYLLSREIFFDKFVLPEFRALNRASDVYYDPLSFIPRDGHNYVSLPWRVGYDPRHTTDSDGTYNFRPVADPQNPLKIVSYEWSKRNQQNDNGPLTGKQAYNDCWAKVSSDVTMNATVTWDTSGTEIRLEGKTIVKEDCDWTQIENDWGASYAFFHDEYEVKWSTKIRIVPKVEKYKDTEVMVSYLDLDVDTNVTASVNSKLKHQNVNMNGHDTGLLSGLQNSMANQYSRIISNIRQRLKTSGRYTYPGNGKLIFEKAGIGKFGDLNAQIRFAPLKKTDWVVVPSSEPTKPETLVHVNPTQSLARPVISQHQLTWTVGSLKALEANQTLELRAVNETSTTQRFATLTFTFRTGKRQGAVFRNEDFELKPKPTQPEGDKTTGGEPGKPAVPSATSTETKPPKKETLAKGIVDLLEGDGQPECQVQVNKLDIEGGLTPFELQIGTVAGNTLALAPGAWIKLTITGDSGVAGQQAVSIDESIRDDMGEDIGHFSKDFEVLVS